MGEGISYFDEGGHGKSVQHVTRETNRRKKVIESNRNTLRDQETELIKFGTVVRQS